MTTEQDKVPRETEQQTKYNLNKVYCATSGVRFYLADRSTIRLGSQSRTLTAAISRIPEKSMQKP